MRESSHTYEGVPLVQNPSIGFSSFMRPLDFHFFPSEKNGGQNLYMKFSNVMREMRT